jgi:hypothetical protein
LCRHCPQIDEAAALASTGSAVPPPRTPASARSSTGVLHFHSHNANIVVKRFAFRKLVNVADDAVKKFLDRKAPERVTVVCSWSSVKCVPEASSTSNNPSVKNTGICPRLAAFEFTARHAQLVCGKRYIYAPHR